MNTLKFLILFLAFIFGWVPVALGVSTEYQRCRARLDHIQDKVEAITNRFSIYDLERENICLGLEAEQEDQKRFSFYPAEGAVEECAAQIFEERANFRRLREELVSTRRTFCESRSKFCPILPSVREVSEPQTLEECNRALELRREENTVLQSKINNARETRTVLSQEREKVCSYHDPGGGFLDTLDPDDIAGSPPFQGTPLEICLGNLEREIERQERRNDRLRQVYDDIAREWNRLCECSSQN